MSGAYDVRLGSPTSLEVSNATSLQRSGLMMSTAQGSSSGGTELIWPLVAIAIIFVLTSVYCGMRQIEQRTTNPPPLASNSAGKSLDRTMGTMTSVSSFNSTWKSLPQPKTGDSVKYPVAGMLSSRSSEGGARAGKALSDRVQVGRRNSARSNRSGGSAARDGRASFGARPSVRPSLSGMSTSTQQCSCSPPGSQQRLTGRGSMLQPRQPPPTLQGSSRFTVPVDTLVEAAEEGSFKIADTTSGMDIRAVVSLNAQGARGVQLFLGDEAPCASVQPSGAPGGPVKLELRGPNGTYFGSLALQANGSFVVHTQERPQYVIEGNDAQMNLHVSDCEGRSVASVSCEQANGEEYIEILVQPSANKVIMVACALAILFLCGEDEEPDSSEY